MGKYKTKANIAEGKIMELLDANKNIYRPWGLVNRMLVNRTLDCASSEVKLIYINNANVRPGFEVNSDAVFLPNLFVKFSGYDENIKNFSKSSEIRSQNSLAYVNFSGFCDSGPERIDVSNFINKDSSLNKEQLIQSEYFPYSYLRREYQILIVNKIDYLIRNKDDMFKGPASKISSEEILTYSMSLDSELMMLFNEFDFALKPPSVIIENNNKTKVTTRQASSLLLLNLIGFDIIIVSGQGYSDIENVLPPDIYSLFYGERISRRKKLNPLTKKVLIYSSALIATAGIVLGGIFIKPNTSENPPSLYVPDTVIDQPINDPDNIEELTPPDSQPENSDDITETGMIINVQDDSMVKQNISTIKITIYGPDGYAINMNEISYTVARGARVDSKNIYTGIGSGWDDGPEFIVSENYDTLSIISSEDGADITYMLSSDNPEYAFLIEGMIDKENYIENRKLEIIYRLNGLDRVFLNADATDETVEEIEYYIYSTESVLAMPSREYNSGCLGKLSTSEGKYLYTNSSNLSLFAYYNSDDGLVLLNESGYGVMSRPINIILDKSKLYKKTFTINPDLKDFKYFMVSVNFPRFISYMWGDVPDDMILNVYYNSITNASLSLSQKLYDEYYRGLANMRLNGSCDVGYDARIEDIFFYLNKSGEQTLNCYFTDSSGNVFRFLGRYGTVDFRLDIFDGDTLLFSKICSPYVEAISFDLPDGSYQATVSPEYDNPLYNMTSYYTLTIDSSSNQPYRLEHLYSE